MKHSLQNRMSSEAGFTLVELAVVMVIIGLLIGGILKGQEMIANAQVNSTIAQVRAVDAAASTFRDIYDAFPGDMAGAGNRLANCAGACAPAGANGNTRLEVVPLGAVGADAEANAFFLQLEAADLLGGVNNANFLDADINGNEMRPGFTNGGAAVGLLGTPRSGHYITITQTGTDAAANLKPIDAGRIDRKLDDGDPTTGSVGGSGGAACGAAGAYDEDSQATTCISVIRIQG